MCCGFMKGVANITIGTASFIYLIFGLTVVAGGFASFFTPEGKALVTPFYAAGALTIGFLIVALGVVGISAISAKQWFRQLLAIFMVFDLATLVACIVIATVFFKYEGMMQLASRSNIEVDLSPAYDEAMSAVKAVVQRTVTKCVPWAQPGSAAGLFTIMCRDVDFEFFGTAVTKCFSHTPLTGNATSRFGQCYDGANAAATAAWPPPTPFGATAAELVNVAESPKGIFCKCSQTFMRLMRPYISYIKWAGIAVMLVFAAVLFACVILWKVKGANQSKHTRGGSIAEDEAKWSKNGGVEFHNVNSLAQP